MANEWDWQHPAQPGTNLPGAVTTQEARSGRMPTWNGVLPSNVSRKAPGAVPIYTGQSGAGGYGGNIQYFDPSTGRFYTENGFIKDNQLANASPEVRAQLAARAAANPGGMLSRSDFTWAQNTMGSVNPNYEAEAAARKAAAGYPGYENHPAYRAPTAQISGPSAQSRYQQALRNGKPLTDPRMIQYVQQQGLTPPSPATRVQPTGYGPISYPTDPRLSRPATTSAGGLQSSPTLPYAMTSAGGLQSATDPIAQLLRSLFAGSSGAGQMMLPGSAAGSAWGGGQAQGYNLLSMLLQGLMQRGGLPTM